MAGGCPNPWTEPVSEAPGSRSSSLLVSASRSWLRRRPVHPRRRCRVAGPSPRVPNFGSLAVSKGIPINGFQSLKKRGSEAEPV